MSMPTPKLVQTSPPLTLLNTPLPRLPAYKVLVVDGSIASTKMEEDRPIPMFLHVAPPSSLLKAWPPPPVPAYKVLGVVESIANAKTRVSVRPALVGLQLSPPSSVLYTPAPVAA